MAIDEHESDGRLKGARIAWERLDAQTALVVTAFMSRLGDRFPGRQAILFGSRARQTHAPDSDADIAVILRGRRANRFSVVQEMAGVAFEVLLETGVNVNALPIWEDELREPANHSNPALLENIRREGLAL